MGRNVGLFGQPLRRFVELQQAASNRDLPAIHSHSQPDLPHRRRSRRIR